MPEVKLEPTRCPVCGTEGNAEELYPAHLPPGSFSTAVFSARRSPDRRRYRMVKCLSCGLVRSDPAADPATLAGLYAGSALDYSEEIGNIRETYGLYLDKAARFLPEKGPLLEIGCGNGFFLEEALARGWPEAAGAEPSLEAAAKAAPGIRPLIRTDVMREGLFPDGHFSIVCMFQVLDHISAPGALLDECAKVLRPGGLVLVLNHNVDAFSARLLGRRSPIVDIEHTFLYGERTLPRLLESRGFQVLETGPVSNKYSLSYLARMLPFGPLRAAVSGLVGLSGAGRIALRARLGNLYCVARRREET